METNCNDPTCWVANFGTVPPSHALPKCEKSWNGPVAGVDMATILVYWSSQLTDGRSGGETRILTNKTTTTYIAATAVFSCCSTCSCQSCHHHHPAAASLNSTTIGRWIALRVSLVLLLVIRCFLASLWSCTTLSDECQECYSKAKV